MRNTTLAAVLATGLLLGSAFAPAGAQTTALPGQAIGTVTITNLTMGQIFAPVLVVVHNAMAEPLFRPGHPASAELRQLAEEGRTDPLSALAMTDRNVLGTAVITGAAGPIMPGETASANFAYDRAHVMISVAGMLVTTNDGFLGANDIRITGGMASYKTVIAWDAGTEANTEDCAHIPGPPCGVHDVAVEEGAEGYVYVHPGIHHHASGASAEQMVDAAKHDWNNPVAKVTVSGFGSSAGRRAR